MNENLIQGKPKETDDFSGHEFLFSENTKIRWYRLSEIKELSDPDEIIPGYLQSDTVQLLYGASGCGKTWAMVEESCCIASGHKFFGQEILGSHRCVYFSLEMTSNTIKKRFEMVTEHFSKEEKTILDENLFIIGSENASRLRQKNSEILYAISAFCAEFHADVIYIDSFIDWMVGYNIRDEQQMNETIDKVRIFAQKNHITVRFIHHATKPSKDNPDNMGGIYIITAVVDGAWLIKSDRKTVSISNENTGNGSVKARTDLAKTIRARIETDGQSYYDYIADEPKQQKNSAVESSNEQLIIRELTSAGTSGLNANELQNKCHRQSKLFTDDRNRMVQENKIILIKRKSDKSERTEKRFYLPKFIKTIDG